MELNKLQQEIKELEKYYQDGTIIRDELLDGIILLGADSPPKALARIIPEEYLADLKNLHFVKTPPTGPNEIFLLQGGETDQIRRAYFKAYNLWHDFFYQK